MKDLIWALVEATESASLACYEHVGSGNEHDADMAAVLAMRSALNKIEFCGEVVIGEGERDNAPMLFIGERVGKAQGDEIDIALDPLEGTQICASHGYGAMCVMAITSAGSFLRAPDVYMKKIAIGVPDPIVSLSMSTKENLNALAKAKSCTVKQITVCILKRERHKDLIEEVRQEGAKIKLIGDGDIAAVISTVLANEIDMYIGTGGSPEGVIAASALKSLGGYMEAQLKLDDTATIQRAASMGIRDPNKIYSIDQLVKNDSIFIATGVTDGSLLSGVKKTATSAKLNSLIITDSSLNYFTKTKFCSKYQ